MRILVEPSKSQYESEKVAGLMKEYFERTGLRALGILVYEEVADVSLDLVKGMRDVEVVYKLEGFWCLMSNNLLLFKFYNYSSVFSKSY